MRVLIFIGYVFRKFPSLLIANVALLVLSSFAEAISVFAMIPIVDLLTNPSLEGASHVTRKILAAMRFAGIPAGLGWILAIFLLFNVIKVGFQIFVKRSILKTKYAVVRDIMVGTFEEFFSARWHFFSSNRQGALLNTFMREITIIGDAFGTMAAFFADILNMMFYLIVPFYLSWKVTSITIIAATLFILPFILLGKISYRLGQIGTATANEVVSVIHEGLNSAKVILGFGNQRKIVKDLNSSFDIHQQATLKYQTLQAAIPLMYYPFGLLVLIIGMLVARGLVLPLSETVVLLYSLFRVIPSIGNFMGQKNALDSFFPSYEQIMTLKNKAKELRQQTGDKRFNGFEKEIILGNLSFAYPDHEPVLVDINVRIPKGKMIAFVGESGSGKSTLIDMIMGFNEPTKGFITIDGIPLRDLDIDTYRHKVGYVPQDNILFNASIRDNLLWSDETAANEEIKHACRQANAEEFIKSFPKGYDTVVGDRGVRLSGGQIQRIALARGILRNPDILILDEATSSLDTNSERLIQEAIENVSKETTVISIAHRLSTVINADYIYVLKKGHVIEEGTYSQLVSKKGELHSMVQRQKL